MKMPCSIKRTGYDMQNTLFSELLRQFSKDKYLVEFQDVNKTNAILTKNNFSYEDIALKDKGEICKILGVDAVMSGTVRMTKPMSDGAGIALALLGVGGATNKTDVSLSINDGEDGKLLWKYDWQTSGSIGSSSESLGKALARNVSKQLPYQKIKFFALFTYLLGSSQPSSRYFFPFQKPFLLLERLVYFQ
jgi:hypothetical protein